MTLLAADNVSISFGGVHAVRDVSFEVAAGQVYSIIGPNGAGKTTLFNLVSRLYDVDAGSITFDGEPITRVPPHQVAERGIARTFQNTELFENETVLKNLLIGHHVHRQTALWEELLFLPKVREQDLVFRQQVEDVIDLLDLQSYRDQIIGNLPYGVRKMVEIARALCLGPRLILLDEPSSGLNPEETEDLSFWIEDINEELDITVVMVEHDMNLVNQVSDRVLVLADGVVIAVGTPNEIQGHPDVLRAYLGD
ncbi:MAG: ABC transporter ATP-binding protein [Pseudomonadota bacterium]|nr:ABC transporter ATP-binding protein [Pseudomonadota bacterium]MED5555036.1 ABC transporter ATP-binding protein [Pseudomonadota bacterium]MEE3133409.1 ABC transporter ATP-binding protein [Pseudomonadota bacterium]